MWNILAQTSSTETDLSVEVTESCADLGPLCDQLAQWTGNEDLASTVSWILGTPVKVAVIAIAALLINRLARRAVTRSMDRLGSASEDASGMPMSERTRERGGLRADTIGSLLRSVVTDVKTLLASPPRVQTTFRLRPRLRRDDGTCHHCRGATLSPGKPLEPTRSAHNGTYPRLIRGAVMPDMRTAATRTIGHSRLSLEHALGYPAAPGCRCVSVLLTGYGRCS